MNQPAATRVSDLSAGRSIFIIWAKAGASGEGPIAAARNFKRSLAVERNAPAAAKAGGMFQLATLASDLKCPGVTRACICGVKVMRVLSMPKGLQMRETIRDSKSIPA